MAGRSIAVRVLAALMAATAPLLALRDAAAATPFLSGKSAVRVLSSTVPRNGDVNPYGVAVVPATRGRLTAGSVLVSNFNNAANLQGTGTTIVEISPSGRRHLFAHLSTSNLPGECPGGIGLTTALAILQGRWVVVGSLPTRDGSAATARAGCLIVLDSDGTPIATLSGTGIDGPWDMTSVDRGDDSFLFVSNVLDGTVAARGHVVNRGFVERIVLDTSGGGVPREDSRTTIASGFSQRTDPAALVIGVTGLGLSASGVLYAADTLNNRIAAIPDALHRAGSAFAGADVTANGFLNAPLGLAVAPNGDILTVNGNNGRIVESTPHGSQIAHRLIDNTGSPPGAGTLFGLALIPDNSGIYFVDDGSNTLNTLT